MGKKSWHEWTQENLDRNCDPEGIVRILLDNRFELPAIRSMMGHRFPESARALPREDRPPPAAPGMRHKREALAAIRRSLSRLDTDRTHIERRHALPAADFLAQYYARNRPVILTGRMEDWKARARWTPEYLKAACGEEMVEIMAGREQNAAYEIDEARHRRQVRFADFVDLVNAAGESNDFYLTARNNFFSRPAVRTLLADIVAFPDLLHGDRVDGMYFWYGPRGTVTPLHHDLMNIFMAQVTGRKLVRMVPPEELDLVYNERGVYSPVDAGTPDYDRHPLYREASVSELILAPGEVLFLPVGWWHYVKALDTSITVTFNNFRFPNAFEWKHS